MFFLLPLFTLSAGVVSFLEEWLNDPILKPATVSLTVYDLDESKYILEHNSEKVLPAASTQKIVSTSIAIKSLGGDHQFESYLGYTGEIKGDILKGDIYIFPNHNPTLASERFGKKLSEITDEIYRFLSEKGITIIGGVKVIDSTLNVQTLPATWIWEDLGNYYGANPSGTVFNENMIEVFFESGAVGKATKVVKTIPDLPSLKIKNRVKGADNNRDLAYAYGGPYESGLVIDGTIPANRKSFKVKVALQNPQKALAYLVYTKLKADKQITVKGKYSAYDRPKKSYTKFGVIKSLDVATIAKATNHKSVNILAENLLQNSYRFAQSKKEQGAWAKQYLKNKMKVDVTGMQLKDGSGLSRFNAISSKQLVQILIEMKGNDTFYQSLPVAGESGTVRGFLKNTALKGNVRCKSGYMQGVKSYAGYIKTLSGKNLAFSVIVNNADGSAYQTQKKIEELLNEVGGM